MCLAFTSMLSQAAVFESEWQRVAASFDFQTDTTRLFVNVQLDCACGAGTSEACGRGDRGGEVAPDLASVEYGYSLCLRHDARANAAFVFAADVGTSTVLLSGRQLFSIVDDVRAGG